MPVNETEINDRIKKQVDNEIAQKRQSINNSLNIQKREFDGTINRNNQYLDEQIKSLNTSKIVNDDKIAALQNRRGGFYSGGLDYQLAENQRNTLSSQDNIRRDINEKNQGVLGQYNTLASQAAENIRMLESQAPDKIRELVNAELTKQRQLQMEEERWNLEKQLKELQIAKARSSGSGGSSSSRSSGGSETNTSSKSTPIAQQFRTESKASQGTATDRYYAAKMKQLNEGRSLARKPIQELYPGLVPNPRRDMSLSYYDRNKILLDSLRGR